jgi:hypothetical protein
LAEWWRYPQEGIQVMFNTNVSRPYGADQKVNTNGEVISIRFDTFAGATKEGVGIGSSKAEVIKAFGNSDPGAFSAGRGTELLVFGSRGISFTVITDKVTAIDIPTRK